MVMVIMVILVRMMMMMMMTVMMMMMEIDVREYATIALRQNLDIALVTHP